MIRMTAMLDTINEIPALVISGVMSCNMIKNLCYAGPEREQHAVFICYVIMTSLGAQYFYLSHIFTFDFAWDHIEHNGVSVKPSDKKVKRS